MANADEVISSFHDSGAALYVYRERNLPHEHDDPWSEVGIVALQITRMYIDGITVSGCLL